MSLIFVGLSSIGSTVSYFSDSESSTANVFRAGLVDIMVARMALPESLPEPVNEDAFTLDIEKGPGSLAFIYSAKGVLKPNAPSSCDEIVLDAWLGSYHYVAPLASFALPATTTVGMWLFEVAVPDSSTIPEEAICEATLVFDAWAQSLPDNSLKIFTDSDSYSFMLKHAPAPVVVESLSSIIEEAVGPQVEELTLPPVEVLEDQEPEGDSQ